MTPERWSQLKEIFRGAVECAPEERSAYLDRICNGDDRMRVEIEALLASHDKSEHFIERPAVATSVSEALSETPSDVTGRRVGQYELLREIGRGGMGTVYLARRADQQYEKLVAVKIVRRGLDTEDILRRFRNERQILAGLEHPNIARLLDGGTTNDGLPFLVMEYVEGTPVNAYCDQHSVSLAERLRIFRTICAGVQHAHQNLVVHRDLKPSNILITADATPKLLDFGIAKLLTPDSSAPEVQNTRTEMRVLTPDYASPEQVRGEKLATTSDVYSLGVVLYELLTGRRPYRATGSGPHDLARIICEQEPTKPSAALADRGTQNVESNAKEDAEQKTNSQSPIRNSKFLKGDLDNIVLMALRKEPDRRYESVAQFSTDIQRHLDGLPVIARKDTFKYRAIKFVQRNRVGVAAAAIILLSLVGGIVTTVWQARAAARQARIATEQRDKARLESSKAESINAFMQRMFASANPSWYAPGHGKRGDVKVVEVLDDASQRIDTEMKDQPEVRAEVHHTIGETYLSLGASGKAEQQFRVALDLYRGVYGERHAKVAENIYYLAGALFWKNGFKSAEPLYHQAIAMMRELDQGNVNLPYMLEDYGSMLAQKGDEADASPLLNEALELFRKRYGDDHFTVASVYGALGTMHMVRGDIELAEPELREAIDRCRRLGVEDGSILALVNLGIVREMKGDITEAEGLYRQALEVARKSVGENYLKSSFPLFYLAKLHYRKADYKEAETEARNALEIRRQSLPDEDPYVTQTLALLSEILIKSGDPTRSAPYLRQAFALNKTAIENGRPDDLTEGELGECLLLLGRDAESEPLLRASYDHLNASYGERSPYTLEAQSRLVRLHQSNQRS